VAVGDGVFKIIEASRSSFLEEAFVFGLWGDIFSEKGFECILVKITKFS